MMDDFNRKKTETVVSSDSMSAVLEHVRSALRDLKYGHVSLIVQDGRVVQLDRVEKTRLTSKSSD